MLIERKFLKKKFGKKNRFILFLFLAFLFAGLFYTNPFLAAWFGFAMAAYSVIANDAIQTIGTFISSNRDRPWYYLWAFTGSLFFATTGYSWYKYTGDVSFQRLASKGFSESPEAFTFLQIAAPIFLLILTRLKIPVSTTFLILSCFATAASTVEKVIIKSLAGYGVAFATAFVVWFSVSKLFEKSGSDEKIQETSTTWRVLQWISTGALWCIWLMQDASNIAVFLPRTLSFGEYFAFSGAVVAGLGIIFWKKGEDIQQVVEEKSNVVNVKAATLVDFIYGFILYVFKIQSNIPMSTTWVFVGLLAGREIARSLAGINEKRGLWDAIKLSLKDLSYVTLGLLISLILAVMTNDAFRKAWLGFLSIVLGFGIVTNVAYADDVSFKSGKGFTLETEDKNYKLTTRLRLQVLNETTIPDDGSSVENEFMLRRARVLFTGHYFNPNNEFKLEIAISPKDLGMTETTPARHTPLLDYYLDFKQNKSLSVRVGQYKIPFSRERVISSGNLLMVDRSITNREFTVDRDTGITLFSKDFLGLDHLKYYAGVYTGLGRNVTSDNEFDLMYVGRIEVLPNGIFKDDYSYADFDNKEEVKTSVGVGYAFIDNARKDKGIIGSPFEDGINHDYHLTTADVMLKYRGFNLHSEFMARASDVETDRNGWGMFGQVGYMAISKRKIEFTARYGGNRAVGAQSSVPENNELLGGVNKYIDKHPFKIQADMGKLWNKDSYWDGDIRGRVQLQSSF